MVKKFIFAVVLAFAAAPGTAPVRANSVPTPPEVFSQILPQSAVAASFRGVPASGERATQHGASTTVHRIAPGRQTRKINLMGRSLALSLMRADRSGLAVLSVPKQSVVTKLPEIAPQAFLDLVATETGCDPVGHVQVVGSSRGTVALATGLTCG